MKKFMALILVALMVVPFGMLATTSVSAADTVLYVKEGGTGDGSAADKALPTIDAANQVAKAVSGNVTIKFVGTVTFAEGTTFTSNVYTEPAHTNKITWTGADASAKLVIASEKAAKYYIMGGELVIKNLAIENSGEKVLCVLTQLHDITVDTGVSVKNTTAGKEAETISIYGSTKTYYADSPYYNKDTFTHTANPNITIKSGSFKQVVAYLGNASTGLTAGKEGITKTVTLDGKVTINVSGADTFISQLHAVVNSYNTVKDCDITLDGGIIGRHVCAVDRKYNAGIVTYGPAGVSGTYNLYLTKNFDLSKQTGLVGVDYSGEFTAALCGTTGNDDFNGSKGDDILGKFILKADAEIYDAINAETVKINKDTFDEVVKVEAPAGGNQGGDNTQGGNADTGDTTAVFAVIALMSVAAVVVLKKRATR